MSINSAQARALAEGFLDGIGNDPNDFKPLECVTKALEIAGEFVQAAQDFCPVHGGKLAASIAGEEPEQLPGGGVSVSITMFSYGKFVDKGVKGTKGGAGLYSFKSDMPSKKMAEAIKEYIKVSRLSTANINNRPISKHEFKNKTISAAQSAFAMARAIKQHGIKPTNFINKAAQVVNDKFDIAMQDALGKDLYNALPDTL